MVLYTIASFIEVGEESLKAMIITVAREFHWPPSIVSGFFIDDLDYEGLEFWYNDVCKVSAEIAAQQPKPKNK